MKGSVGARLHQRYPMHTKARHAEQRAGLDVVLAFFADYFMASIPLFIADLW